MVVDTSAFLAILFREPEADLFTIAIRSATTRVISVASVLEAAIVVQRRFERCDDIDPLIEELPLELIPVDFDQIRWARYAFETYGRGRHPARLNFGDCFSYALAKATGEPLLFKGNDFSHTDLAAVIL
jgi:ribonuclease VapC